MNTPATRIASVNVIECCHYGQITVHAYPETSEGNAAAEAHFRAIAGEQEMGEPTSGIPLFHDLDLDVGVETGILEDGNGWKLYLVHSEV